MDDSGLKIGSGGAQKEGGPIYAFFNEYLSKCQPDKYGLLRDIRIIKDQDILIKKSDVEIDLSNKTKNGSNNLYIQSFEVVISPIK